MSPADGSVCSPDGVVVTQPGKAFAVLPTPHNAAAAAEQTGVDATASVMNRQVCQCRGAALRRVADVSAGLEP
jgi:hypothetical protein